jgi:serine protease SohB
MARINILGPLKAVLPKAWTAEGTLIPVIRLSGTIGMATPLRQGLTIATLSGVIERAFSIKDSPAVAVLVNSPGGSPVQSRFIYQRIRAKAHEEAKKVFVFAEDVAASGGYILALAGDEIYADASSILGSIGVISAGFGLHEAIERIGVERRVYTAGEKKMTLDPFQPEEPDDVERLKRIQKIVHEDFINLVRERRGSKIEAAGDQLFTGEFWTGRQALDLGLIDGLGDVRSRMRALYGEDVRLRLISPERGLFFRRQRGVGVAGGASLEPAASLTRGWADELVSAIEERALWARFGL